MDWRHLWAQQGPRRFWEVILFGTLGAAAFAVMLAGLIALVLAPTLPSVAGLAHDSLAAPLEIYTRSGQLIAQFGDEQRLPIHFAQIPPLQIKALLAAEDADFYHEPGVNFAGIVRAAIADFRSHSKAQGGSTITMQVARDYFLTPKKTFTRKIKEVLLAFKLDQTYTKDQILTLYANKVFLGNHAYGLAAAAQIYYGKPLAGLDLAQMAMLAGLPKAPSADNPIRSPDNALIRRTYVLTRMRDLGYISQADFAKANAEPIATRLHSVHFAVEAPYVAEMVREYVASHFDATRYADGFRVYTTLSGEDQAAADRALQDGLLDYDRRHGYRGPLARVHLGPNATAATLDAALQDYHALGPLLPAVVTAVGPQDVMAYTQEGDAVDIPWTGLSWARPDLGPNAVGPSPTTAAEVVRLGDVIEVQKRAQGWSLAETPQVEGALVSLTPQTGAIVALSGGFDFYLSNFNRVTQALRQPGSNFKPFIYSAALDKGFTAASMLSGAPIVVNDPSLEEKWRPEDYSRKFFGPTRLRKALALSLNLVSVRLLRAIGPDYAANYLGRFGFDPATLPKDLSLVLGTASVTPLQMASAFAVFANGGYRVTPYFITRIEDAHGHVLFNADPAVTPGTVLPPPLVSPQNAPAATASVSTASAPAVAAGAPAPAQAPAPATILAPQVISADNAFIMTSMMEDVIHYGTGAAAEALGRKDIAGKTGTTNHQRDAWFSGFNPDLVTSVWVGFDQPATLGHDEVGAVAALPIWMRYMATALAGFPDHAIEPPPGIVEATINRDTGLLTTASDPRAMREYFIKGTAPSTSAPPAGSTPVGGSVRQGLF